MNGSVAENTLSKKENNVVQVSHESCDVYYRTGTQELLFLTPDAASGLDKHTSEFAKVVDDYHSANEEYSLAIEEYGKLKSQIDQSAELKQKAEAIAKKESVLAEKREALQKELGKFESEGAGYKDVVELIPIPTKKNGSGSKKRYAFAKKWYVDNLGRGVKHKVKFKQSDSESIFRRDSNKKIIGISVSRLKKQLTDMESENKGVNLFGPIEKKLIDKTLTDWADSWNKSLVYNNENSQYMDFSAGAQFMRCTTNLGMSGEWDPASGKLALKGEAKAALSLAAGTVEAAFYLPARVGWALTFQPANRTQPVKMGMLRICLKTSLIGFVGASAQVEAQLQVTTFNGKQLITGNSEGRLPRFRERQVSGATFHKAREKNDDGLKLSGEAFGGARAEFKIEGGVQWLQPPELTAHQGKTGDDAKEAGEFVDFCTFTESLVGMAGAGIGGALQCDFVNGKFCFKIAASLCVGIGAKGNFEASVDFDKLYDFSKWLIYQLYGLDYAFFEVISKEAFKAFTQIQVMLMSEMKSALENSLRAGKESLDTIEKNFKIWVDKACSVYDGSEKRNKLASTILSEPNSLLLRTPESKGILLYLLTRHGTWDHLDSANRGSYFLDIYPTRKQAVLVILHSIQTQQEWYQVFRHFNAHGDDLANGDSALKFMVAQNKMNELRRFLQEGFNEDDEMEAIYMQLRCAPFWGYALTMNNTIAYRLTTADNPFYPRSGKFSPLSGTIETE